MLQLVVPKVAPRPNLVNLDAKVPTGLCGVILGLELDEPVLVDVEGNGAIQLHRPGFDDVEVIDALSLDDEGAVRGKHPVVHFAGQSNLIREAQRQEGFDDIQQVVCLVRLIGGVKLHVLVEVILVQHHQLSVLSHYDGCVALRTEE